MEAIIPSPENAVTSLPSLNASSFTTLTEARTTASLRAASLIDQLALTEELEIEHHARLYRVMAVGHFQYAVRLCLLQFGEKALVAEIDAEDRNAGTGEIPGKLQNRTVAAERDDEPRAGSAIGRAAVGISRGQVFSSPSLRKGEMRTSCPYLRSASAMASVEARPWSRWAFGQSRTYPSFIFRSPFHVPA